MKIGQSLFRVCRNHAHTGRSHARINNMVFKKFQKIQLKMPFQWKNQKNLKIEKKKTSTKLKTYNYKYTFTKSCSEKKMVNKRNIDF